MRNRPRHGARLLIVAIFAAAAAVRHAAADGPAPSAAGLVWSSAPGVSPDPTAPTSLRDVQAWMRAGDTRRALGAAERFAESKRWGRERDAALLLAGLLHREEGRHNLASEAFTQIRAAKGPLAAWASYYEAEQDLARGKGWVAVKECEAYEAQWPAGDHRWACVRLRAKALASLGKTSAALEIAAAYDAEHVDAPIGEQVALRIAAWEVRNAPESAVRRLRELAVAHAAPLTGRLAEELLAELAAQGVSGAILPDDDGSLQRRAISLRDGGRLDEAVAIYRELERRADDDPALRGWVAAEAPVFGYRTRSWDLLLRHYEARYAATRSAEDLHQVYKTLVRAGRWAEAAEAARIGLRDHGRASPWRNQEEPLAHTFLLAGAYDDARALLDERAARGGWTGRRAAWLAAFASLQGGHAGDALTRFERILAEGRHHPTESRYWAAKALDALDRPDEAEAHRAWIRENEPESWYGVLVALPDARWAGAPWARDGRWPGAPMPALAPPPAELRTGAVPIARRVPVRDAIPSAALGGSQPTVALARLSWPLSAPLPAPATSPPSLVEEDLTRPPASYVRSALFDEPTARADLHRRSELLAAEWPELAIVHDLSSVGLYDHSGPLLSRVFEAARAAMGARSDPRRAAAEKLWMPQPEWRQLFLVARDHHHATRFVTGLDDELEDPELKLAARRLAWPLAHDRYVWSHARENDVDPFLVLGLMRTESVYDALAVSRVGARGAMQIMPRTGHLLANLRHDTSFTAGDLEDPLLSIGMGLDYLGQLMRRFDGVYPLAVASYNGGPHNVSAWLKGAGTEMPMDVFVEHIPFRETRNYVQKVSASYATYLSLYAPHGSHVVVPPHAAGDDPGVVDF